MIIPTSTPLSILPTPSASTVSPPPGPTETPNEAGASHEPSPFAKLLQERQNASTPPALGTDAAKPSRPDRPSQASDTPHGDAPNTSKTQASRATQPPPADDTAGNTNATNRAATNRKLSKLAVLAAGQSPTSDKPAKSIKKSLPDTNTDPLAGASQAAVPTPAAQSNLMTLNTAQGPRGRQDHPGDTPPVDALSPSVTQTPVVSAPASESSTTQAAAPSTDVGSPARQVAERSWLAVQTERASGRDLNAKHSTESMPQENALASTSLDRPVTVTPEPGEHAKGLTPADRSALGNASATALPGSGLSAIPPAGDALRGLAALTDKDHPRTDSVNDISGVSPSGMLAATASQRTNESTPAIVVATPVQAPEFKEALATQVTLMAKDGLQQASLQLNPADMGPISVQISMDGTQTRVDFAVDSAATRQIIEAGLPELASALRDAGLTLSGGGVSQQSSQSAQQEAASRQAQQGQRTHAGLDEIPLVEARTSRTVSVSQGGLDLYA